MFSEHQVEASSRRELERSGRQRGDQRYEVHRSCATDPTLNPHFQISNLANNITSELGHVAGEVGAELGHVTSDLASEFGHLASEVSAQFGHLAMEQGSLGVHINPGHELIGWLVGEKLHEGVGGGPTKGHFKVVKEVASIAFADSHGARSGNSTEDLGSPVFEGVDETVAQHCDSRQGLQATNRLWLGSG
jgi:hypothetical protein